MTINLYPYNMYILIAAALAVLVCIGMTLSGAAKTRNALKSLSAPDISGQLARLEQKSVAASASISKGAGYLKIGIIFMIAAGILSNNVKKAEGKGFTKAHNIVRNTLKDTEADIKILRILKKLI